MLATTHQQGRNISNDGRHITKKTKDKTIKEYVVLDGEQKKKKGKTKLNKTCQSKTKATMMNDLCEKISFVFLCLLGEVFRRRRRRSCCTRKSQSIDNHRFEQNTYLVSSSSSSSSSRVSFNPSALPANTRNSN